MAELLVFDFVTGRVYLQASGGTKKTVEAPVEVSATPAPPAAPPANA